MDDGGGGGDGVMGCGSTMELMMVVMVGWLMVVLRSKIEAQPKSWFAVSLGP